MNFVQQQNYIQNVFFTSDHHFYHKKLMENTRPLFKTVEEMNEQLIVNWNKKITCLDVVFVLGDLFWVTSGVTKENMQKIISALHYKELHFIMGNHDDKKWIKHLAPFFKTISDLQFIKVDGQKIMVSHYPMRSWRADEHDSYNLHGHTHGLMKPLRNQLDVGIDCHYYFPISFNEVQSIMETQK